MLDIRPVSDLRNDFASIEKKVQGSKQPVFLTKNGHGSMVVMSLDAYSQITAGEHIEQALDEADAHAKTHPETLTHDTVFTRLKGKLDDQNL